MAVGSTRALGFLLAFAAAPLASADDHLGVDVAIVLAVDVSGSMDRDELEVQREGYLAALRDPDLHRVVGTGRQGRIALAHFEWAGSVRRESTVDWTLIDGPGAIDAFAEAIEALPVRNSFGTSISLALDYAMELIDAAGFTADSWVIDVSGDGPNNMGPPVTEARDRALARGVTINGLPILIRPSRGATDLDAYYEQCVIGGLGAFVLPVRAVEELAPAIRRKLFMELIGQPAERLRLAAEPETVDCMVGERLRRERGWY